MSKGEILQRLASRANEADALIKALKEKILTVRTALLSDVEQKLLQENKGFLQEVDELKSRLSELQHENGAVHIKPYDAENSSHGKKQPDKTNVTPAATKNEQKPKKAKPANDKKVQNNPKKAAEDNVPIDFRRLDLRVGRIISATKHPDADSLYVEKVDVGESEPRTVVSGLVNFIPIEKMSDRMAILMCNLKPVKMRGVLSQAMVMCASSPDKVEILDPPAGSIPGELVEVEGFPSGVADAQLNPKKKIWEQVAPDLKTNSELLATYKGIPFKIANKGFVTTPSLGDVQIK